jgi:hypothetical protein
MPEDTTINGLSTALAATAAADDLLPIWDASAGAMKKHAASYMARSDGASGNKLITGSGRELTVSATGTAALIATGSWSPSITVAGASPGTQTVSGVYYTIGDFVWVWARIDMTSRNDSTGALGIETLPFAGAGTKQFMFDIIWANANADMIAMTGYLDQTYRSSILVHGLTAAGQIMATRLNDTHIKSDTILIVSGCYEK